MMRTSIGEHKFKNEKPLIREVFLRQNQPLLYDFFGIIKGIEKE